MTIHTFDFDKKEKLIGMTWEEKAEYLQRLWSEWDKLKQCTWTCPACGTQCSGVEGHSGPHQCKVHYEKGVSFKDLEEERKRTKQWCYLDFLSGYYLLRHFGLQ